jgi:hypothetical protein
MTIKHVILHEGKEFEIGGTDIHPFIINGHDEQTASIWESDEYTIKKLAAYPCAGDSYMHMFQIFNHSDYDLHFYITHNKCYYDANGYLDKIIYDDKLQAKDVMNAFIEFAKYCEPRSM